VAGVAAGLAVAGVVVVGGGVGEGAGGAEEAAGVGVESGGDYLVEVGKCKTMEYESQARSNLLCFKTQRSNLVKWLCSSDGRYMWKNCCGSQIFCYCQIKFPYIDLAGHHPGRGV